MSCGGVCVDVLCSWQISVVPDWRQSGAIEDGELPRRRCVSVGRGAEIVASQGRHDAVARLSRSRRSGFVSALWSPESHGLRLKDSYRLKLHNTSHCFRQSNLRDWGV